jgi:hypothetical protein
LLEQYAFVHTAAPIAGAVLVVLVGKWLARRAGRDNEGDSAPADQRAA